MKLRRLHLKAFGPFTDRVIDFGTATQRLVLVHGANEAGKSSTLRAISDLRFGIPLHSKDNFIHAHPDMRVGGEFVDRQGNEYSLIRRKGRGTTLCFADFDLGGLALETPVPPDVEILLNGGLRKEEYESMFGLDHRQLREGGQALLNGEGDVGAALFEASAGIRSIPQILERLDASARKFFMPGARGKNARINEAMKAYEERHGEYKQALVRPAHWADVFKKHQAAATDVAELEARRGELNTKLLLIKELRAVAPVISTLQHASRILDDLKSVPLLSLTAATERAAAESGLSDAQHNAKLASAEAVGQQQRLDELKLDVAILDVAPAVKRLAASAESIDQHRRDLADATVDVTTETEQVIRLAAQIDASRSAETVGEHAPARTARVSIEQLLHAVELAEQALKQHQESGRQSMDAEESPAEALPSPESRTMLRIAQAELARSDSDLKRLASLPGEIKAARRAVANGLEAVGLVDEAALRRVQPLLDAQIDVAMKQENASATRRDALEKRIDQISEALRNELSQRDRLLAKGEVPTRDDVEMARSHRDAEWTLLRGIYIDGTSSPTDALTSEKPLPAAYEDAVIQADRLVDELASDTERAAALQSSKRAIETLETDCSELKHQLEELDRDEETRQATWHQTLAAANLPALSPAALRDWQALLPVARTACETLQSKLDEFEQVQATEQALASQLRAAIVATGRAMPAGEARLSTLSATASEVDAEIKQRETAINQAAGKRLERERQFQQRAAHEDELTSALRNARDALNPAFAGLLLPEDTTVAVARARMREFEDLMDAKDRLASAQAKEHRANQALALLDDAAKAIWQVLGGSEPLDLRLHIEQVSARLIAAEEVQTKRTLAQQALEAAQKTQREHEDTGARHQQVLSTLCLAAGVDSANHLPEAEEQSRRKRDAQSEVDRSSSHLAQASRRSVDELRTLLADYDAARMDADETNFSEELNQLELRLRSARECEELARRTLDAIDGSDTAVAAREDMERAAASIRANMSPWIRSRLAHALLAEALKRFRDRAQGPMLTAASSYFSRMTRGEFVRLISDDSDKEPALIAERTSGSRIRVEEMSEGTLDQLYLALRLAALDLRRAAGVDLPVILDDVLMTSDDDRSGAILEALADFAGENQVLVFTHHRHMVELAQRHVPAENLAVIAL